MDVIEFARLGAKARNKKLTKAQRSAAARHAVNIRWERARANPGPLMPCGWKCGAKLTATGMREHFSRCPKRPAVNGNGAKRK